MFRRLALIDLTPLAHAAEVLGGAAGLRSFLGKLLGPALSETGGLIADPIAEWRKGISARRRERFDHITSSTKAHLEATQTEPIQIPDYIALPLIETATLIDDESLQEKWAWLLANAAMPDATLPVSPLFPKILANLSPREAKFLDVIFDYSIAQIAIKIEPLAADIIARHSRMDDERLTNAVGNSDFRWKSNHEKAFVLDRLFGEGVFRREQAIDPKSYPALAGKLFAEAEIKTPRKLPTDTVVHMQDFYQLTVMGAEFISACRPPRKRT